MSKLTPRADSLFLSLSTYPSYEPKAYLKAVDTNFANIQNRRKETLIGRPKDYNYYSPSHFQMYGHWDLLTISAVDSSTQITSILQPELSEKDISYNNYKILSGLSFEGEGVEPLDVGEVSKEKFVALSSYKLSNKWIIGNGEILFNDVITEIKEKYAGRNYSLMLSYSSYEIILIEYTDCIKESSMIINSLREMTICSLTHYEELELLYKEKSHLGQTETSNVISDSNTIFGFRLDENFGIPEKLKSIKLHMSYEIEVKPTHVEYVTKCLKELKLEFSLRPGKADLVTYIQETTILDSLSGMIIRDIAADRGILARIRKLQSILMLPLTKGSPGHEPIPLKSVVIIDFKSLNADLRTIGVSKSIRAQIIKLFLNFKNQINDSLNLNQFLDILEFVKNLRGIIRTKAQKKANFFKGYDVKLESVHKLESTLKSKIETFYNAYLQRHINEHTFEDASDFLIESSQFQNLATSYDNYIKCLYGVVQKTKTPSILTTFRNSVTIQKDNNVKLSTFNLFEPASVFVLVIKEVLNLYIRENNSIQDKLEAIKKLRIGENYFASRPDSILKYYKDIISEFDFAYVVNDYIRVKYFFQGDFKMYYWWQRAMLVQQPSNYSGNGELKRRQILTELKRCYLTGLLLGLDEFQLSFIERMPPLQETSVDWKRYFHYVVDYCKEIDIRTKLRESIHPDILSDEFYKVDIQNSMFNDIWVKSYKLISDIYERGNQKIPFLARSWDDGKYEFRSSFQEVRIKDENKQEGGARENDGEDLKEPYFLFDPQGGVFFYNYDRMIEYSKLRNSLIYELYLFSCRFKKNIYNNHNKTVAI